MATVNLYRVLSLVGTVGFLKVASHAKATETTKLQEKTHPRTPCSIRIALRKEGPQVVPFKDKTGMNPSNDGFVVA